MNPNMECSSPKDRGESDDDDSSTRARKTRRRSTKSTKRSRSCSSDNDGKNHRAGGYRQLHRSALPSTRTGAGDEHSLLEELGLTSIVLEDAVARHIAREVQMCTEEEIQKYLNSNEFKIMIESLKRREREKMLDEITTEIAKERENLLNAERKKINLELSKLRGSESILVENQKVIEDKQRKDLEKKQLEDAARLKEVQRRQQLKRERHDAQLKEDQERKKSEAEAQNLILNRGKKLSFGIKKTIF